MPHSDHGDSRRVVLAALLGNAAIAIAKFVAAFFSGSVTLLAEGVHSLADTANQALLLVGMNLAKKRNPELYPLGRDREIYFWAFIVSLTLFFLGGVYAIYEGVHRLLTPGAPGTSLLASVVVLVVSLAIESSSFVVAVREFNKSRSGQGVWDALFTAKDPTIPVVLLEDLGAVLGLLLALIAVTVSWVTGSVVADAVGSIAIGVLLCCIGVLLLSDTRSLLIGESADPRVRARALQAASSVEGVEEVTQALTLHLGPKTILLALKVRFRADLRLEEVERTTNLLEAEVRRVVPQMKRIFVEADSVYDPSLDPEATPQG